MWIEAYLWYTWIPPYQLFEQFASTSLTQKLKFVFSLDFIFINGHNSAYRCSEYKCKFWYLSSIFANNLNTSIVKEYQQKYIHILEEILTWRNALVAIRRHNLLCNLSYQWPEILGWSFFCFRSNEPCLLFFVSFFSLLEWVSS